MPDYNQNSHSLSGMESDPNPDISGAPEMPLGLSMSLAQNTDAMTYFGSLDKSRQAQVIDYVTASSTGEEAKSRIKTAVNELSHHNTGFLS